jgi:hypothetical protein
VLLSTLLQDTFHPSHHLLNVLLQIANKLGLSNKKKNVYFFYSDDGSDMFFQNIGFTIPKQCHITEDGILLSHSRENPKSYVYNDCLPIFNKTEMLGNISVILKKKFHGLSPRANYTGRATAACRRSDCQLVRIEGATWSA